jgi:hypothetical protein
MDVSDLLPCALDGQMLQEIDPEKVFRGMREIRPLGSVKEPRKLREGKAV